MISFIKKFFTKGHERSVKAKRQFAYSFVVKGLSIVVGLAFVPLLLKVLDAERYGIWLTISSIITWFTFFDIGLGNGLRNKLAEAIATGKVELARVYISTTYAILGIVCAGLLVIFNVVIPFINWQSVLNTSYVENQELVVVALIVFNFFVIGFLLKLIGSVLLAHQRPAVSNAFGPTGNLLSFLIINGIVLLAKGSMVTVALVMSVSPVVVLLVATVFLYSRDYATLRPSLSHVDFSHAKDLFGLGVKFFFMQVVAVILFSMTNILIAQFSSQKMVAAYNVAYKYFSVAIMGYTILLSPMWSAVTDAYHKHDYKWLKNTMKTLNMLSIVVGSGILLMLVVSTYVFEAWVGDKVDIPFALSTAIAIYLIILAVEAPLSNFINGVGKLRVMLALYVVQLSIFLPLAYYLGTKFGAVGIVSSMIVVQLPPLFFQFRQVHLLLNQKATGIWNK